MTRCFIIKQVTYIQILHLAEREWKNLFIEGKNYLTAINGYYDITYLFQGKDHLVTASTRLLLVPGPRLPVPTSRSPAQTPAPPPSRPIGRFELRKSYHWGITYLTFFRKFELISKISSDMPVHWIFSHRKNNFFHYFDRTHLEPFILKQLK